MTPGIINGNTELIAHIGFPTHSFKAPIRYKLWFDKAGVNARVMPMGCKPDDFAALLKSLFTLTNMRGALITMPHRVATLALLEGVSPAAAIARACNAGDAMPMDGSRLDSTAFGGGVVMKSKMTGFLAAAEARGCVQIGTDMLFEQIPAYLEFSGNPSTTAQELREVATLAH